MANDRLILRTLPSPFNFPTSDTVKNSVLAWEDMDNNFIFLKGRSISGLTYANDIVTVKLTNGTTYPVTITGISSDTFVTGGTVVGEVLTLRRNDGVDISIDLSASTYEAVLYTNSASTYVTIGGIEAGSTFSAVTMQDMWTDLLYPNLNPSFASFSISGISTSVDVGYTFSADDRTFIWTTNNSGFVKPNTLSIYDATAAIYLATGLANDGSELVNIPYNIQKTTRVNNTFRIYAQKLNNTWFYRDLNMYWSWRRYWGGSSDTMLDASGITGLTNNELSRYSTGDFDFAADLTYKYIVIPKTSGWVNPNYITNPYGYWTSNHVPISIKDAATGLNIALAGASDGYTDTTSTGLPYKEIASVPNIYGYSDTYYIFRTKYKLGGEITIEIE